jgi:hypothetical protein
MLEEEWQNIILMHNLGFTYFQRVLLSSVPKISCWSSSGIQLGLIYGNI